MTERHRPEETGTMSLQARAVLSQAGTLMEQGDADRSGQLLAHILALDPENGDAWALQSELLIRRRDFAAATDAIRHAVSSTPDRIAFRIQEARCLVLADRLDRAREAAETLIQTGIDTPNELAQLASVLAHCEDQEAALMLYERALDLDPSHVEAMRGLIAVYRFLGRIEAADALCDTFLVARPDDAEMMHLRSSLRDQTPEHNHVDGLRARLKDGALDWRARVHLLYGLAKELEDLGQYDASFAALREGADLRRANTVYDVVQDIRIFPAIERAFNAPDILRDKQGHPSTEPIFVVGMPRSGTTLVERIIAGHSDVYAAGELHHFATELVAATMKVHGDIAGRRLELPSLALSIDFEALGRRYLAAVRYKKRNASHFVDKMPLNFLYIGYIFAALPEARIIHVMRDSMDNCFAMYKHLFKGAYPFSYNLNDLSLYFFAYHNMMKFWKTCFPGRIIEVEYEKLVADQSAESRRLIDALGLDWQESCLDFHRNTAPSTTGSATQVRRALYQSSVGKWQHYREHLQPLRSRLSKFGLVR